MNDASAEEANEMAESLTIQRGLGRKKCRVVTVTIGEAYRVDPLNPQKKKHRDRVCTILEFEDEFLPASAAVRFHDTNRVGKVDLSDLVPVNGLDPIGESDDTGPVAE